MPENDRLGNALKWAKSFAPAPSETRKPKHDYRALRKRQDPYFRHVLRLRAMIPLAIKAHGHSQHKRLRALIGCSIHDFRKHLQSLWLPGMRWQNYGKWHADHKRPCASFDLNDPAQIQECFHFSNFQPLWATENLQKGAKWNGAVHRAKPVSWEERMRREAECAVG